jgi:uncharacterized membrane protein
VVVADTTTATEAHMDPIRTPDWIRSMVGNLESNRSIDGSLGLYDRASTRLNEGRTGAVLRGEWLGHALHPLMTDVPLGCWMSASLLDLVGGRRSRASARRLLGIGILAAVPTAASGLADYGTIETQTSRRVAAVHGAGNTLALLAYVRSWRLRGRGHHLRGMAWALSGGAMAVVTGYLGGHLSFARAVGTGERSLGLEASPRVDGDGERRPSDTADLSSSLAP